MSRQSRLRAPSKPSTAVISWPVYGWRKIRPDWGFTLIELMVVIAIIGLLAALAIPKYAMMVERTREASTKGNLMSIHTAVALYYSTRDGRYPDGIETNATSEFSRYLESIPPVKATHAGVGSGVAESPSGTSVLYTTNEDVTATGVGWRYSSATGHVFVNSSTTDTHGVPYSTYGY